MKKKVRVFFKLTLEGIDPKTLKFFEIIEAHFRFYPKTGAKAFFPYFIFVVA